MEDKQDRAFREALERKKAQEEGKKAIPSEHPDEKISEDHSQNVPSPRAKNSRKGKTTADKWNQ